LSALARGKGILSAADGAHTPGMMRFNLHELGCDFLLLESAQVAASAEGIGILYVRNEVMIECGTRSPPKAWDDKKIRARKIPAHRQFERTGVVGTAGGDPTGK